MATRTWKARILRYMAHNGFVPDMSPPRTMKYTKYRHAKEGLWYYVGKSGAVHISRDGTHGSAVSMTDMVRRHVALWEKTPAGELVRHQAGERL